MHSVLLTTVVSFLLCMLLTPLVRGLSLRWGLVDQPDGARKLHTRAVPRTGGIAIAISYAAAYGVLMASPMRGGAWLQGELLVMWLVVPAAVVALATGILDDIVSIAPLVKLSGQVAAALLAYAGGVQIASVAGVHIAGWWSLPLTVLWLVGCANAFNLIDGVDGLATGVGLVATMTIFGAALLQHNTALALATAPMAACLLGFLRYNFNPASIFLGDSGSLLVGFLLGCYGVIWSQKSATILGMTAPLMALAVPLLDTALAILRRFLRARPIFGADRGHMHHRLLDLGLTPRGVALSLYAVCGLAAALSLLTAMVDGAYAAVVVVVFLAAAWMGIQRLDYGEFQAARRAVFGGELQSMVNTEMALRQLTGAIHSASDLDGCWRALEAGCAELGYPRVELSVAGRRIRGSSQGAGRESVALPSWYVYVPLSESDYVLLGRDSDSSERSSVIGPLADTVRNTLRTRLAELTLVDAAEPVTATASLFRLEQAIRQHQAGEPSAAPAKPERLSKVS